MNAEGLLQHYERIADAPDAIARLRRFILDLAVRGKLVAQKSQDEPASELLKRVAAEKARLLAGGRLKKSAIRSADCSIDAPFGLPQSWAWARLGDIAQYGLPDKVDSNKGLAPDAWVLDLEDIEKDTSKLIERVSAATRSFKSTKTMFRSGDVLFGKLRPYLNKVLVADRDGVCTSEIVPIRCYCGIAPEYVAWLLKSPLTMERVDRLMYGMKMPRLGTEDAIGLPFPLPPLAEQHHIVAKVDELMALCDRLAAARAEREAARDRLAAASLARLNAPDPQTFHEDARFALDALPALTARPDQIKQLRQTILSLALSGKLSPPGAWSDRLTPLCKVASLQNGYAFKSEWFSTSGIRLLRNANVSHETLDWSEAVYLPESQAAEFERFELRAGDVVLSLDRPFIATGTKVARVVKGDLPALLLQRVGRFVLSDEVHPDYLFLWIQSPHFYAQIDPGRSNGVPHISSKHVEQAVLPIPPIAEQRRIVTKVRELMILCDRLGASLASAAQRRHRLINTVLKEALHPAVALEEAA